MPKSCAAPATLDSHGPTGNLRRGGTGTRAFLQKERKAEDLDREGAREVGSGRKTRTIQFVGRGAPRRTAPHRTSPHRTARYFLGEARGYVQDTQATFEN